MKIINLGAHKTGTKSLREAMRSMGYKIAPQNRWYQRENFKLQVKGGILTGIFQILQEDYDFYCDSPFNFNQIYKNIDSENTKFILTIRDPKKWFDSFVQWAKKMPYVNSPEGDSAFSYGGYIVEENRCVIMCRYNLRNHAIKDYFGDKLCVIDVDDKDKMNTLCEFLDIKRPDFEWPHLNKAN